MKKQSRRARRMERHHKLRKQSPLNLVSLMDIFTILVFFLLVNSSSSQQLPSQKEVKLPTSISKKAPRDTLVLVVTEHRLLLQGRQVATLDSLSKNGGDIIEPLKKELQFQASKKSPGEAKVDDKGYAITIMGDENIPYELMSRILATCQSAKYTGIAFAAMQKSKKKS